jgi:hypothetical protein
MIAENVSPATVLTVQNVGGQTASSFTAYEFAAGALSPSATDDVSQELRALNFGNSIGPRFAKPNDGKSKQERLLLHLAQSGCPEACTIHDPTATDENCRSESSGGQHSVTTDSYVSAQSQIVLDIEKVSWGTKPPARVFKVLLRHPS